MCPQKRLSASAVWGGRRTVARGGADFIDFPWAAGAGSEATYGRNEGRPRVAGFSQLQNRAVLIAAFVVAVGVAPAAGPACADPLMDANAAVARGDFAAAVPLYRALAEKGNVAAQKQLGYLYEIGAGVERDWLKAAKWYGKAADAGDDGAAAALGYLRRNWVRMNPTDNGAMYALVEKAARMGNAKAQFSLGL